MKTIINYVACVIITALIVFCLMVYLSEKDPKKQIFEQVTEANMDQYQGLYDKNNSVVNSFFIIEQYTVDGNNLKIFQQALESLSWDNSYLPGFHAEKLNV